jgi:hypothetical protein
MGHTYIYTPGGIKIAVDARGDGSNAQEVVVVPPEGQTATVLRAAADADNSGGGSPFDFETDGIDCFGGSEIHFLVTATGSIGDITGTLVEESYDGGTTWQSAAYVGVDISNLGSFTGDIADVIVVRPLSGTTPAFRTFPCSQVRLKVRVAASGTVPGLAVKGITRWASPEHRAIAAW